MVAWVACFLSGLVLLGFVRSFLTNEFLQFPLPNEGLYLLVQVITFRCVVSMISVEMTIFVPGFLTGISLQFAGECHGSFIFDLHQDLINRGIQGGEVCEPPLLGAWIIDHLFYLPFLPSFSPYPAGLPPASLSSWASPHEPAVHLQHSYTWWPCKVHPTWFSGHSCIRRIETYPFVTRS